MKHSTLLALVAFVLVPAAASGQQRKPPVADFKQAHVGFNAYASDGKGRFKVGMWAPVYVKIKAGLDGIRPKTKDELPHIRVETQDSEDVSTIFRSNFTMEPNEERLVMSYVRPGPAPINITVHVGDLTLNAPLGPLQSGPLGLNSHLYVSLGDRIPDLQATLVALAKGQPQQQQQFPGMQPGDLGTWPRFAGFESDATLLPDRWFAYQGVDLMFLSTRDKDFLLQLAKDNDASRDRLKAIAQWVRRGGRLVIPVAPRNADVLAQVLQSTVWQPPLPVVPPREGTFEVDQLGSVENFSRVAGKFFRGDPKNPLKLAVLEPSKMIPGAWEVLAAEKLPSGESKPVIARMPYGLGSITYLAFPLDDAPFTSWDAGGQRKDDNARVEFLKQLLGKLAPRVNPTVSEFDDMQQASNDLSSQLQRNLDQFDVRIIPFGYVALFIILYIIIVGPLDFLLLKYVFKRLEWTWFTFPTVVIAVSIAAYYTAYAIKGHDLKINKVDVVDIDMRTNIDVKGETKKASVYGRTFFTILSPRIQNYTVGIEPNAAFWGQTVQEPLSADMVTWLGRADPGFGGMGARGGSQGFFRKPYRYNEDASGVIDVPIPVWTTKSFEAAWEAPNVPAPVDADLRYYRGLVEGKDLRVAGKLTSKLPVDLEDAWLFYLDKAYALETIPSGAELKLALEQTQGKEISQWFSSAADGGRIQTAQGLYNPSIVMRRALFNERVSTNPNEIRNHALRPLDLSWRIDGEAAGVRDQRIREAILVARVKFEVGNAETMTASVDSPLPANLWLGTIPSDGGTRPELAGILAQDTFVRIIIPVKPNQ